MPNEIINVKQWTALVKKLQNEIKRLKREQNKILKAQQQKKELQRIRSKINYEKRKQQVLHERAQIGASVLDISYRKKFENFTSPRIKGTTALQIKQGKLKFKKTTIYGTTLYMGYIEDIISRLRTKLESVASSLANDDTSKDEVQERIDEWKQTVEDLIYKSTHTKITFYKQLFQESAMVYQEMIRELQEIINDKE